MFLCFKLETIVSSCAELTIVLSLKHKYTQPLCIFNRVRVLYLDRLKEGTWLHSFGVHSAPRSFCLGIQSIRPSIFGVWRSNRTLQKMDRAWNSQTESFIDCLFNDVLVAKKKKSAARILSTNMPSTIMLSKLNLSAWLQVHIWVIYLCNWL